jgi:GntR family transcriptional regulator
MHSYDFAEMRIDGKSALPVYEQVKRAIKLAIFTGRLKNGDATASIRDLAQKLKLNPNTVLKAYGQLETEGFLTSRPGLGYFVSLDLSKTSREKGDLFESLASDFVARVLDLGYSREDLLRRIHDILGSTKSETERKI